MDLLFPRMTMDIYFGELLSVESLDFTGKLSMIGRVALGIYITLDFTLATSESAILCRFSNGRVPQYKWDILADEFGLHQPYTLY